MIRTKILENNKKTTFSFLCLFIISLFVINPKLNMDAFFTGISVWGKSVLPAIFPFLFFTKILAEMGGAERFGKLLAPITKRLFHTSGISGYIYSMSILSGYPMGAKLTSDFYNMGYINKDEAHRICTFTSTSGPLFIIGTVGIGMFFNQTIGIIILISHFLSAIFNGLLFRNYKYQKHSPLEICRTFKIKEDENLLEICMLSSIKSILIIGGYIALSFMLISMINHYNLFLPIYSLLSNLFGLEFALSKSLLNGIMEITKGCFDLSLLQIDKKICTVLATSIISFGGISVHLQAYTFLNSIGIKYSFFVLQKITHTAFSILCALFFVNILF